MLVLPRTFENVDFSQVCTAFYCMKCRGIAVTDYSHSIVKQNFGEFSAREILGSGIDRIQFRLGIIPTQL